MDTCEKKLKDEDILVLSLKKPSFFGLLVDRYQSPFLRAAFNIVNQKEESEDVVQEAFVKIYLNAKRFEKREGKTFKSWAYKIVINTALTHYVKTKKRNERAEYLDDFAYPDAENDLYGESGNFEESADRKMLIENALSAMPVHLAKSLRRYYLEDKTQKDIADEEKVSVATIKMRLFRARKNFKKILNEKNLLWATEKIK